MPHLQLHTSPDLIENVDIADLLADLCRTFCEFESIEAKAVKAYHTMHSNWSMGAAQPSGFAHLTILLLEGRSPELIESLGAKMHAEMKRLFAQSVALGEIIPTVELREMPKSRYWK